VSESIHIVSDDEATLTDWLMRTEPLHRVLRPDLPTDYQTYLRLMFSEGAKMAALHEAGVPKALTVYRILHTTFNGRRFYVDDLVTVEGERGRGYGSTVLRWLEDQARENGCQAFALDSGVQRSAAHRFYFRQGMSIMAFGFSKSLR
jgi:GNAT superfamily N-acetyltransferase